MIAAKRSNQEGLIVVFGITSNGKTWQFGRLEGDRFTRHVVPYSIYDLDALFGAVHYVFQQCRIQLGRYVAIVPKYGY